MQAQFVTEECKQEFYQLYQDSFNNEVPQNIIDVIDHDGICIFSEQNRMIKGIVILAPLQNQDSSSSVVLLTCKCVLNNDSACELMKEGVMTAYELGYKLALSTDDCSLYESIGFEQISNVKISNIAQNSNLIALELAWDALKATQEELYLPNYHQN